MAINFNDAQRKIAKALGIKNPNSQNDLNQINAASKSAGVKSANSSRDVAQVTAGRARSSQQAPQPAAAAPAKTSENRFGSSSRGSSFGWRPDMAPKMRDRTSYGQRSAAANSGGGGGDGWDRYLNGGTSRFAGDKVKAFMGG